MYVCHSSSVSVSGCLVEHDSKGPPGLDEFRNLECVKEMHECATPSWLVGVCCVQVCLHYCDSWPLCIL